MNRLLGIYQMFNGKEREKNMIMAHEKCKDMTVGLVQIGQTLFTTKKQ